MEAVVDAASGLLNTEAGHNDKEASDRAEIRAVHMGDGKSWKKP